MVEVEVHFLNYELLFFNYFQFDGGFEALHEVNCKLKNVVAVDLAFLDLN